MNEKKSIYLIEVFDAMTNHQGEPIEFSHNYVGYCSTEEKAKELCESFNQKFFRSSKVREETVRYPAFVYVEVKNLDHY
ncbi:hypothetical protein [Aureibacillus halotolerans]|uniref:Uncharacterized protein n=1 Tax=Aureibacillus halotolerans TaxID=1508390 RepID=A0A4R6U896_9BACI|nr:hypothetical protein [Aureibacillus halotolerans]TDQ42768.1 hypothetical protein EV213_101197 [Aureibacillus halotolerans]